MKRLFWCLAPLALAALVVGQPTPGNAQSVLSVAKGLKSNNVSVFINRAVVLDSTVPFVEVSVANPAIADVQPISNSSIYIFGRARGTTSLTLLGENGQLITNVLVKVQPDHSELKRRLREILPREPIEVRTAGNGLVLSGTISGKAKIDKAMSLSRAYAGDNVINMMTVGGTQQVMLKVKVAEIARGATKDLGVQLAVDGNNSNTTVDIDTGVEGAGFGVFGAIFSIADNYLLDIQIDALETKGFARTLSEPNLVSLSGVEAKFLAGGEVPIPVIGDDGDVSVEFKPVGVSLNFLPRVIDDDIINVSLSAEVTEVGDSTTVIAGVESSDFVTRRAETTVELRDGQAFAIAGLLQEQFQDNIDQVPWLGDLPVLGALFRSTDYQRGQTELVIFISAHLVTPVGSEDDIALPTDRIGIPNEASLFLMGDTAGPAGAGGSGVGLTGSSFDGAYGYVVE